MLYILVMTYLSKGIVHTKEMAFKAENVCIEYGDTWMKDQLIHPLYGNTHPTYTCTLKK